MGDGVPNQLVALDLAGGLESYDASTGATEVVIERPGGAFQPTPAPDGAHLACLHRGMQCTVLILMDRTRTLGATMSTIDSVPLLASSLVVENLYVPLTKREVSQKRGVRLARWTTLGIGALAMTVAIDPPATILFIVTMSFSLLASAFTFPLLLGMWWPRATRTGALAAMIGGAATCCFSSRWGSASSRAS